MLVIALAFLLLVVIFAVQNAYLVPLSFLGWTLEISQALVVLGAASIGVIIGAIWLWVKSFASKGRIKELTRELQSSKNKITDLENALNEEKMERAKVEVESKNLGV